MSIRQASADRAYRTLGALRKYYQYVLDESITHHSHLPSLIDDYSADAASYDVFADDPQDWREGHPDEDRPQHPDYRHRQSLKSHNITIKRDGSIQTNFGIFTND